MTLWNWFLSICSTFGYWSKLLCVTLSHFYLLLILSMILLYHNISVDPLKNIWVVFSFWQLWIELLKTFVYKSLYECNFISLGLIPTTGLDGLCGKCMSNFIRNYQTIFQSYFTVALEISHSHQQSMKFPLVLHAHQYLLLSGFFMLAILDV